MLRLIQKAPSEVSRQAYLGRQFQSWENALSYSLGFASGGMQGRQSLEDIKPEQKLVE